MGSTARHHCGGRLAVASLLLPCTALLLCACPGYAIVTDGTSVSFGPSNRGMLINPARVPRRGVGFFSPPVWHQRGLRYGTDEMIALIRHVGYRMHAHDRRIAVGVADLSPRHGGPSAWHHSHQTGRDVDLLFIARDDSGKLIRMTSMVRFGADGKATLTSQGESQPRPPQTVHFDVPSNWILVREVIQNPIAQVQYIFVSDGLRQLLLEHAIDIGESEQVILTASHLLRQPNGVPPHDDHFHVRIYCASSDRALGCRDRGRLRWNKKHYKYGLEPRATAAIAATEAFKDTPMPAMMALVPVSLRP